MKSNTFTTLAILLAASSVAQSRRWFAPEVNCWITQEKVPTSWKYARRRCERHGAILASPLNTHMFDYMQSLISVHNHSAAYFIGTRAKGSNDGQEVNYVSVEGKRLDDMPKAVYDAIEQLDLEQGHCLSMDRHGIRAVSCSDRLPYICYSNETMECGLAPAPTTTPLPKLKMPPGYKYKQATGSFYKYYERRVTWDEANATCASEGAHLVVVNDAEEADIVANIVRREQPYVGGDGIWTGLRDDGPRGAMNWNRTYGESLSEVFHVWRSGRPYPPPTGRACVTFSTYSKDLLDEYCDDKFYITCERSL